jgi:hypothetical protein
LPDEQQAYRAERVLTGYLQERLDLTNALDSPAAVEARLRQAGFTASLGEETAAFLAACTAARFAPGLKRNHPDWAARTTRLLLALEADSWRLPVS